MFVEDLPDDFDYQEILDENAELRSCLQSVLIWGSQQNEKGEWITIKQLTGRDMDAIKACLDKYR